jgi:hypothetical protein
MCADSSASYYVGVCDYGQAAAGQDPDAMLQGAKNGAMTNTNSHLIREQKINLSVVPGIAFDAENDKAHFSAHVYIAGTTLYQVLVVYPIGNAPQNVAGFLDSFGLISRSGQ